MDFSRYTQWINGDSKLNWPDWIIRNYRVGNQTISADSERRKRRRNKRGLSLIQNLLFEFFRKKVFCCFTLKELNWLALLLVRLIENETGASWDSIRREVQRLHIGHFSTKDGDLYRTTTSTAKQKEIFKKVGVDLPPKN